jgi:AcrR family transcriptional regulator
MARAGLDKASVIEAASRLADSEGLEAVTLARLAKDLNVKTPSLYNHVDSLSALRRDLAIRGLRLANAAMQKATVGKAREEALLALAVSYRNFARAHPGLHLASLAAPSAEDAEHEAAGKAVLETVMAVLSGFGLEGEDSYHAVRALRAVIHGFVSLEAAGGFGMALDVEESMKRLLRTFARGLGADPHPLTAPTPNPAP